MNKLIEIITDSCDIHGVDIRHSYSGRGMYGDKCLGIVGGMDALNRVVTDICLTLTTEAYDIGFKHAQAVADPSIREAEDIYEDLQAILNYETDNMGLLKILYWRHIPAIEEEGWDEMT